MEQHTVHNDPSGQADIFDMETHHKAQHGHGEDPPVASPASASHKPDVKSALADRLLKLTPGHMAMITAGIICVGLVLSRLATHVSVPSSADNQLLPADYQQLVAPPAADRTPPATAPRADKERAPQGPQQQSATPASEPDRAIIRTALEDLNARVARLEAEAARASAAAQADHPVKPEPPRIARTQTVKKPSPAARPDALPVLVGYSLNTIYPNQAWIEHDGATYAVQVGDKIGSLAITGIDARARRVSTPNGQIR